MQYRYYVHDSKNNVGVTEFGSDIWGTFIECLCDCVGWFAYESENTTDYEIYIHIGEKKKMITFLTPYVALFDGGKEVRIESIRDYIKSTFKEV